MWLEAVLSKDDFVALAEQVLPLTIHLRQQLDADHYVRLIGPAEVSLVSGRGLRLKCKAEIRWPVLGVDIPIAVNSLTLLLEPSIATPLGGDEASFKLELESADLQWVPALVDRGIVHAINVALHDEEAKLTWHFSKTLSHVFGLPEMLEPLHALSLKVAWGKVRTTEEAVVFAVSFQTRAVRKDEVLPEPSTAAIADQDRATDPSSPPGPPSLAPRAMAVASTLVGLVTGYVAFGGLYRLLARPANDRRRRAR